jgi:hypothetical protein
LFPGPRCCNRNRSAAGSPPAVAMMLQILSVRHHGLAAGATSRSSQCVLFRRRIARVVGELCSFGDTFPYARSLNSEGTIYFTLHRSKSIFSVGMVSRTCDAGRSRIAALSRGRIFASSDLRYSPDASLTKVRHLQRFQRNTAVGTNRHGNHVGSLQSIYVSSTWISLASRTRRTLFFPTA